MKVNRYYSDQLRSVLYQLIDASKLMPPKDQAEFSGDCGKISVLLLIRWRALRNAFAVYRR